MQGITPIRSDELVDFDDRGKPRTRIRVQFKVDDDGPFTLFFDKDGFSATAARTGMEVFAREIRGLRP